MKKDFNNHTDLWFDAMVIEENKAWIFANNFNALFELNLDNKKIEYLGSVPNEPAFVKGLYFNILKCGPKLVLIPASASTVAVFDLEERKFETVEIDLYGIKCFGAVSYKNKVFLIGNSTPAILVLDINLMSIHKLDFCEKYYKKNDHISERMYFRKNNCVVNNVYYVASCVSNTIFKINLETEEIKSVEIQCSGSGLRNITFDGIKFWISKWGLCEVVCWDEKNNRIDEIKIGNEEFYNSSELVLINNKIVMYPTIGNHVYTYDIYKEQSSIENIYDNYISFESCYPWGNQKFTSVIPKENQVYSYCANIFALLVHDYNKGCVASIQLNIDGLKIEKELMSDSQFLKESEELSLKDFIDCL